MLAYSHTIFIKASVLLENGAREVRGRGQIYKDKNSPRNRGRYYHQFHNSQHFLELWKVPFPSILQVVQIIIGAYKNDVAGD